MNRRRGPAGSEPLLPHKLRDILGDPATDLDVVSAYFVPTAAGFEAFVALAQRGVKIRVLTNSLEATDVAVVHAGYARRRKPLLEAGITLYEILAQRIATAFREAIPADAYEVRLSETGDLYWIEHREEGSVRHATEPGTTFWKRTAVRILSLLPIEGLL